MEEKPGEQVIHTITEPDIVTTVTEPDTYTTTVEAGAVTTTTEAGEVTTVTAEDEIKVTTEAGEEHVTTTCNEYLQTVKEESYTTEVVEGSVTETTEYKEYVSVTQEESYVTDFIQGETIVSKEDVISTTYTTETSWNPVTEIKDPYSQTDAVNNDGQVAAASISEEGETTDMQYTVKLGDSLTRIVKDAMPSISDEEAYKLALKIAEDNVIDANNIQVGQTISLKNIESLYELVKNGQ